MKNKHPTLLFASIVVLCTACESAPEAATVMRMDPVATSNAPLTSINSIALADETTACVIESYEDRIHCLGPNGQALGAFGRPGEGPGEFRSLMDVVGGPNGTIGAIDWGLARMTVFQTTGTVVSESVFPSLGPSGRGHPSIPFCSATAWQTAPATCQLGCPDRAVDWYDIGGLEFGG